jgi:hypothetical protein
VSRDGHLSLRRAALWSLLVAKLVGGWGLTWDIQWHLTVGRDSFWIAPHVMIYASVVAALVIAFAVLGIDTARARRGPPPAATLTVLGITGSRGFHLAAWGMALVVLAAPIDDLWHRLFGLDVTLWSPPHLLGLFGSAVNTLGCLLVAVEVYPRGLRRAGAVVVGGALLYAGLRVTLDPAWLIAYARGGVLFHGYAMLGALVLPLALVPVARLSSRRWAPALAVAAAIAVGVAGLGIARAGFAILQPASFVAGEIVADPTSAIALNAEIAAKNRAAPDPWVLRLLLPLVPALVLSAMDPRRRPLAATLAYGVTLFAAYGWYTTIRPAFQPASPTFGETLAALVLTIAAAGAGGAAARWLAHALEPPAEADAAPSLAAPAVTPAGR